MKKYLIIVQLFLCSCSYINDKLGLKDDNIVEEMIEGVIEAKTGMNFDLTPGTQE